MIYTSLKSDRRGLSPLARIRTIKPDFFRHGGLQDLEAAHPGKYTMMVFAGLWGHCDKNGVFKCSPRHLKLDILPFLDFDMEETLQILQDAGLLELLEYGGETYGYIKSFSDHQRISGKEAEQSGKHPEPSILKGGSNGEAPVKHPESQEGKGKERKEEHCSFGKEPKKNSYPEKFEAFWSNAYPVRPTDTKKLAFKAWEKGCKAVGPDDLFKAAKAYAAFCSEKNHESMLIATWVNREGWTAALKASKPTIGGGDVQQREQDWYGTA